MNGKIFIKLLRSLALMLATLAVLAATSFGAIVNLVAEEAVLTIDGTVIPMWGYFPDTGACNTGPPLPWDIGPQINVPSGDTTLTLTVNLRNCLDTDATSLVITGQTLPADGLGHPLAPTIVTGRVTSFTQNAPAGGGTMTYNWTNLKEGTYLYHSGTHAALQQPMGLYGAAKVEPIASQAYGNPYGNEQILLYSEIDPALHSPTPTVAKPLNYKPKYFLVNGQPFTAGTLAAGNVNGTILLRLLNAGLKPHVPTLLNGYLQVIAEDGNLYPYPKEQYSAFLAAGKTMDALFVPTAAGTYPLFDRSLSLTTNGVTDGGMYSLLTVTDVVGLPVADAGPDQAGVSLGALVTLDGSGSFDPDSQPGPFTYSWSLISAPAGSVAALSDPTVVNPTFTTDSDGVYVAELTVNDGASDSVADSVTITTNLTPVANAGPDQLIAATTPTPVTLDGSGSFDPDTLPGSLTYSWSFVSIPATSVAVLAGPTSVNPGFIADLAGDYVVQLIVNDGDLGSAADTVTITVNPNLPPVAADDTATTLRLTPVTIDLVANDSDPEGALNPTSVVITSQPNRGGAAVNQFNGTVIYTPRRGFKGTDVFTYTVSDLAGNVSNEATVRVNVVR